MNHVAHKPRIIRSRLLDHAEMSELLECKDLAYEDGYRFIAELCQRHVNIVKDSLYSDRTLPPEELQRRLDEIRFYQGIIDLPKSVSEILRSRVDS